MDLDLPGLRRLAGLLRVDERALHLLWLASLGLWLRLRGAAGVLVQHLFVRKAPQFGG